MTDPTGDTPPFCAPVTCNIPCTVGAPAGTNQSCGAGQDVLSALGAYEPSLLAFARRTDGSSPEEESCLRLVTASSRCPFRTKDGTLLNVECFGPAYGGARRGNETASIANEKKAGGEDDDSNIVVTKHHRHSVSNSDEWPLLLYVHGICESAETWGVQTLAQNCMKHCWRLVVLELEGHGLSGDGGAALGGVGRGRATCPDFDLLVSHVVEFVAKMQVKFEFAKGMAIAGGSLGATLVAYAVRDILKLREGEPAANIENAQISKSGAAVHPVPTVANHTKETHQDQSDEQTNRPQFYGIAMLAPALGIDPRAIPSPAVVTALRGLSYLLPSHGILTPIEETHHYACPPSSTRNFAGRWPLATSAMLLDLTSHRVPDDVKSGAVSRGLKGLPSLLVIAGERDEVVPVSCVQQWFDQVAHLSTEKGEKELVLFKGAGHGFIHDRDHWNAAFVEKLFDWLNKCAFAVDPGDN